MAMRLKCGLVLVCVTTLATGVCSLFSQLAATVGFALVICFAAAVLMFAFQDLLGTEKQPWLVWQGEPKISPFMQSILMMMIGFLIMILGCAGALFVLLNGLSEVPL